MVASVLKLSLFLTALLCAADQCVCWDQAELDLFDLVEEVGENFYDVLHVEQSATQAEIKRSFRQLSLQLHPDKSDDPDATEKFRKVVAVAEVLKDPELRERYDLILVEGLPDWRQPIYYYRRVRKMGLLELSILLLMMGSVAQYLYGLAVYIEKKLVMQEVLTRKQKKSVKKPKTAKASAISQRLEEELSFLNQQATASIPAVHNILPFWLAKKVFALAKYLWSLYWQWWHSTSTKSETDIATEEKSHETSAKTSENTTEGVNRNIDVHKSGSGSDVESSKEAEDGASDGDGDGEGTKVRRRRGKWVPEELRASAKREEDKPYVPPAYYCEDEELNSDEDSESSSDVDEPSQLQTQHTSSSHAQSSLLQEMGSNSTEANTECIKQDSTMDDVQEMDGKSVEDVCVLSVADKRIDVEDKEDCEATDTSSKGGTSVVMVSNSKDGKTSSSWSRYQQKQLEWALVQYPKFAMDRWDNIAKAVPGKNKEECIERFKELCVIVKSKRNSSGNSTV